MAIRHVGIAAKGLIAELRRRYVWWEPIGDEPHSEVRIIAQAMNLGTFDDIRRLEQTLGSDRLADVMLQAEPGWFSARSWEFWRGRLSLALGKAIPEEPPRRSLYAALDDAIALQDTPDTLAVLATMPSGPVKISFFGGIGFGRVKEPLQTRDGTLLVASLDDLMATKLKATLDRAEARDYRDIAQMISAGVSLSRGLGAFKQMFKGEPSQVLRAIGYFRDGDLPSLAKADQELLRNARDRVIDVPDVRVTPGSLAVPLGECG